MNQILFFFKAKYILLQGAKMNTIIVNILFLLSVLCFSYGIYLFSFPIFLLFVGFVLFITAGIIGKNK